MDGIRLDCVSLVGVCIDLGINWDLIVSCTRNFANALLCSDGKSLYVCYYYLDKY